MSKADAWMPLYISDHLADTMHLNAQQQGAYLLLLMHHWRAGSVPNDEDQLSAIGRCDLHTWKKSVWPLLRAFFREQDGVLIQKRAAAERELAEELTDKRSKAGAEGAKKRWGRDRKKNRKPDGEDDSGANPDDDGNADSKRIAKPMANQCQTASQNDTPSPSPIPSVSSLRSDTGDAAPPPRDVRTQLWTDGLMTLRDLTGRPDGPSRAFLGRLLRDMGDDCAGCLRILDEAADVRPGHPEAWISAAAKARMAPNNQQSARPVTRRQAEFDANDARIRELMGQEAPDFFNGPTIDGTTIDGTLQ